MSARSRSLSVIFAGAQEPTGYLARMRFAQSCLSAAMRLSESLNSPIRTTPVDPAAPAGDGAINATIRPSNGATTAARLSIRVPLSSTSAARHSDAPVFNPQLGTADRKSEKARAERAHACGPPCCPRRPRLRWSGTFQLAAAAGWEEPTRTCLSDEARRDPMTSHDTAVAPQPMHALELAN